MTHLKQIAALLLAVAALLASMLAFTVAQKREVLQKQSVGTVTKAILETQEEPILKSSLNTAFSEAKILGSEVQNMAVDTAEASIDTTGVVKAIETKATAAEKEKEKDEAEKSESINSQAPATQASTADPSDDYNYPDFCGRLYIPSAGINVALYNNTDQETCTRPDSAAVFPKRPEDGGSNFVADNELETLGSVGIGTYAYVITPSGQQINYVCVDTFNGHNDVSGFDALQKDDGTMVWGTAELIIYTSLGDDYNVRVACFNRS